LIKSPYKPGITIYKCLEKRNFHRMLNSPFMSAGYRAWGSGIFQRVNIYFQMNYWFCIFFQIIFFAIFVG
jgi:hypothetical protein